MVAGGRGWQDPLWTSAAHTVVEVDAREEHMEHVDTYAPGLIVGDVMKTVAARLVSAVSALLRKRTAQHVSGSWMEQHQRDAAKH